MADYDIITGPNQKNINILTKLLDFGTLVNSTPFTAKQTWNNSSTSFVGSSNDFIDTASAAGSILERWTVGGTSLVEIDKVGNVKINSPTSASSQTVAALAVVGGIASSGAIRAVGFIGTGDVSAGTNGGLLLGNNGGLRTSGNGVFSLRDGTNASNAGLTVGTLTATGTILGNIIAVGNTATLLASPSVGQIYQRSGVTSQSYSLANTYTSQNSFESLFLGFTSASNTAMIGTQKGSAGGTARDLALMTDDVARLTISAAGNITMTPASEVKVGTTLTLFTNGNALFSTLGATQIWGPANGTTVLSIGGTAGANITSTTAATSAGVAALTTAGGIYATGAIWANASMYVQNSGGFIWNTALSLRQSGNLLQVRNAANNADASLTALKGTFTDDVETSTVGKGVILKSPNGTRFRITVTDAGALVQTSL